MPLKSIERPHQGTSHMASAQTDTEPGASQELVATYLINMPAARWCSKSAPANLGRMREGEGSSIVHIGPQLKKH